jgi:hypothetical protein
MSWMGILQYLRLFSAFRDLVEIIKQTIFEVTRFTFIYVIMMIAFAIFYMYKSFFRMENGM